jgi:hypothetical protein
MSKKKLPSEYNQSSNENLVEDLLQSLRTTINGTRDDLESLQLMIEDMIKNQAISKETKKIIESINTELKNFSIKEYKDKVDATEYTRIYTTSEEEE